MNIEFLDLIISASLTLRKLKSINIQQNKTFKLRAQIHPMIISPFGTHKSSTTKLLVNKFPKDIIIMDNFTKASIEGSVTKDGDYVPSILIRVGGKIFIIDEWNNVDYYGQSSLLSLLENQSSTRGLGFKVKSPFTYKDKYMKFTIKENIINVKGVFSCIAYAMEYPIYEQSQKAKALLSRFSPLFIEATKELIDCITKGEYEINVEDNCMDILEEINITFECQQEVNKLFFNYIDNHNLWPVDTDDYGFITRAYSEIIRYGCYNYIKQNRNKLVKVKNVTIDNIIYFTEMFDYIHTLLLQFNNPQTKGKIVQFKKLLEAFPDETKTFYAKKLGVSIQTIYNMLNKLK